MAGKIYLKAPTAEAWSKAVHHFKNSSYHVELGEKFSTLVVSVTPPHHLAAGHIIKLLDLTRITEAEFRARAVGVPEVDLRELSETPRAQAPRVELKPQPKPPSARPEIPGDRCLCGRTGKRASLASHRTLCPVWLKFLQDHRQQILEESISLPFYKVCSFWHLGPLVLKRMQVEAGLVKTKELTPFVRRMLHLEVPQTPTPEIAEKKGTTPPVGAGDSGNPDGRALEAIKWLIDRRNELEKENEGLKKVVQEQSAKLRLLKKLIGEV